MKYGWFCGLFATLLLMAAPAVRTAHAVEVSILDPSSLYEARFGAFAHGVGFEEQGGVDLSAELVFPRLALGVPQQWKWLVPRPHLGAMIATSSNKTSYGFVGFVWTLDVWPSMFPNLFIEPIFGAAIHNGLLERPVPGDRVALGCSVLFHTGASIGYRVTNRLTVLGTWEHISNGKLCSENVGSNNYGVKLGYSF